MQRHCQRRWRVSKTGWRQNSGVISSVARNLLLEKTYFVYLLASKSRRLYVGVTSNLERRLYEYKHKLVDGFTKLYSIDRLVFFEATNDVRSAIEREKQIKKWRREKKIALIETMNPVWEDLSDGWIQEREKADFSPKRPGSK